MSGTRKSSDDIRRHAAEWCVIMASGEASKAEKARFAEWLTASPRHIEEYAAAESLWEEARQFGTALGHDERVVSLYPLRSNAPKRIVAPRPRLSRLLAPLAAVAATFALLFFASRLLESTSPAVQRFDTAIGETRLLTLADGSLVELNTASALSVEFTDAQRLLRLESGEAFFKVKKDPERPFIVAVDATEVRAIGTAFNVKAIDADLAVTVVEGEVEVSGKEDTIAGLAAGRTTWRRNLVADRQLIVHRNAVLPRVLERPVAVEKVTSWRDNKLVFEDALLGEVVADFNRYNRKRIVLADSGLETLRISGTFDPRDPDAFARTVAKIAGVEVAARMPGRIELVH